MSTPGAMRSGCALFCPMEALGLTTVLGHMSHSCKLLGHMAEHSQFIPDWTAAARQINVLSVSPILTLKSSL